MKLLENGKDSLKKAIKKLNNLSRGYDALEYECTLKDIVINLHHSIETMFKYMIKEKDEFLLYSNCDEIFKWNVLNKFNNNKNIEIRTIQFIDAIHRVIVLYNINIKKEDYNKFKNLNEIRNSLTHYERDFSDNEIEHLIALILPILLKVYKENIEGFDNWANQNGIYGNVKSITADMQPWAVRRYYALQENSGNAIRESSKLESLPLEKKEKFLNKNADVSYLDCSLCKNKLFHATGNYIVNADEIVYLGKCEYCGFEVKKVDAQFIALYYGSYYDYENGTSKNLQDIMISVLISGKLENTGLVDKIIETLSFKEGILEELKYRFGYAIVDIITIVAEEYFQTKIYSYNDVMENVIENQDCKISLNIVDLVNGVIIKEELLKKINRILILINKITVRNDDLGEKLQDYINTEYLSYNTGIYLDFDGNDVEREITFIVSFKCEEVRQMLNRILYKEI